MYIDKKTGYDDNDVKELAQFRKHCVAHDEHVFDRIIGSRLKGKEVDKKGNPIVEFNCAWVGFSGTKSDKWTEAREDETSWESKTNFDKAQLRELEVYQKAVGGQLLGKNHSPKSVDYVPTRWCHYLQQKNKLEFDRTISV